MGKFLKWFKDSLQLDLYCDCLYTYKYRLIIINKLITKIGQLFICSWLIYFSILFNFHFWCLFDLTIMYYSDGGFYFCFRFRFVTAFSCQNVYIWFTIWILGRAYKLQSFCFWWEICLIHFCFSGISNSSSTLQQLSLVSNSFIMSNRTRKNSFIRRGRAIVLFNAVEK